jgi:uncharacterized protein YajQ (UPF0234 family)
MTDEHSFDIVSRVDMQEVVNSIQQADKEVSQRFDFKGSKSSMSLDKDKNEIVLISDNDQKLKSLIDVLQSKFIKRHVPLKSLSYGKIETASGGTVRQVITIQQGIPQEKAKEIIKLIKDTKLKVQSEIQKDQLRVRAKKIDDLQTLIGMIKNNDFGIHIEFINYR